MENKTTSEVNAAESEPRAMTEAEAAAYLEKVDKESQTRKFKGFMLQLLNLLCVIVTLYHLYVSFMGPPPVHKHRSLHVGMMLVLAFLMYPMGKFASRRKMAFYDWIFCGLSIAIPVYIWFD